MKIGDKIKLCNNSKDISNFGGCADATKLTMLGIYEIEDIRVHSWHTKLKLKGIEGMFNSEHFEKTNN